MKNGKIAVSLLLACVMVLGLAVSAGAAATPTPTPYSGGEAVPAPTAPMASQTTRTTGDGTRVPFVGVIKPTQIKCTIPTRVVFNIDPTVETYLDAGYTPKSGGSKFTDQVTDPGNITITNQSDVPIYVYVDSVTANNVTLTDTIATLNTNTNKKYLMFGLKAATPADALTVKDNWILGSGTNHKVTAGGKHYFITAGAGDANTRLEATGAADKKDEVTMKILAVTRYGWEADNTFSVVPVFVVSVKNPDKTYPAPAAPTVTPPQDIVVPALTPTP